MYRNNFEFDLFKGNFVFRDSIICFYMLVKYFSEVNVKNVFLWKS